MGHQHTSFALLAARAKLCPGMRHPDRVLRLQCASALPRHVQCVWQTARLWIGGEELGTCCKRQARTLHSDACMCCHAWRSRALPAEQAQALLHLISLFSVSVSRKALRSFVSLISVAHQLQAECAAILLQC